MAQVIYKICRADEWREAERAGVVPRRADRPQRRLHPFLDRRAGRPRPRRGISPASATSCWSRSTRPRSGRRCKWEPSRGGALFPHLYGALPLDAVLWVKPLPLGADGRHMFPELAP